MKSEFIHLHNHSDYSLLDGAQKIDELLETITNLNLIASNKDFSILISPLVYKKFVLTNSKSSK